MSLQLFMAIVAGGRGIMSVFNCRCIYVGAHVGAYFMYVRIPFGEKDTDCKERERPEMSPNIKT